MKTFLAILLLSAAAFAQDGAKYPGAIPTRQDLPYAENNAETKLTSTITANSRSFTVLDPEKFRKPTFVTIYGPAPDYTNREIVLICDIQGNTLFACPNGRGVDPSMPAAYHKYGDTVAALVTAEYLNKLSAEVVSIATTLGVNLANVIKNGQATGGDLTGPMPNPTVRSLNGGKPIPVGDVVGTTDEQLLTNKTVTGIFYGPLHGNADTATTAVQLASDPVDCLTGKYAFGINNKSDLNCKSVDWAEVINKPTAMPPNGPATGDLSGSYPSPSVATVGGKTALSIASTVDAVSIATDANVAGAIVKRSVGGGISSTLFTGALSGNASTASALLNKPAACVAGKYANDIAKSGDLSCLQVQFSELGGLISFTQLPDSGAVAATYGSASEIPILNVDAKGRILSASKTTVVLPNSGVAAGTYGSETKSARFVVGADGRITSVTELSIPGTDGSGYVSVKNGATLLAQRSILQITNGLVATDDGPNNTSIIGLSTSGATPGTYGNASSVATIAVDSYGRVTSVTSQGISIDASQIGSGTISMSRLNQSPLNTAGALVARDGSGNFNAGTITANSFVGALTGNASTATNVAWTGVTGKPAIAYADAGSYNLNITGNAATATNVAWTGITGKPTIVYADGGTYGINVSGTAASASAVPWTGVSGKPTNFVYNDGGSWSINITGTSVYASSANAATQWTGSHQISWAFGDGTSLLFPMSSNVPVFRNRNYTTAGFTTLACRADSGSVNVTIVGQGGNTVGSATCGTGWTGISLNGYANLNRWDELSFRVTGTAGSPSMVSFEGAYSVTY